MRFSGGLEFSEGKQAAQLLAQWGFDALEINHGLRGKPYEETEFKINISSPDREAYFRPCCKEIKGLVDVPIMMVGGLRPSELMEEIIKSSHANFISLSRPLIREPGIINEWKRGNRRRPACISCNQCLEALRKGDELRCVQESLKGKGYEN